MAACCFKVFFYVYIATYYCFVSTIQTSTVVLAFSGLRWDTMQKFSLPSFKVIQKNGVYVERKIDAFQTESLPSFVTMATGEYPESHGILSDSMYDVNKKKHFNVANTEKYWWYHVKPVWIENQLTGNRSALCYWPGHNVLFNGTKAHFSCHNRSYFDPINKLDIKKYSQHTMSFSKRVKFVEDLLKLNATVRPNFIGVYFEEPMQSIQKFGYDSPQVSKVFNVVNNLTQRMLNCVSKNKNLNLIVLGEAGITELDETKRIYLEDHVSLDYMKFDVIDDGPIMSIHPNRRGDELKLIDILSNVNNHMKVYPRNNLTKQMHYAFPGRTCPIYLVADEHWHIYRDRVADPRKALMGFDGKFKSTHSMFLGIGPNFKKGVTLRVMGNKDVYYILRRLLKFQSMNKTLEDKKLLDTMLRSIKRKWYTKIATEVTGNTLNMTLAIIFGVVILFTVVYLIVASVFKCADLCNCYGKTVKLSVSPHKLLKSRHNKDGGGGHLLSEDEISSAESDTDNELKEFSASRK